MPHAVRRQLVTAAVAASSVALVAAPSAGAKSNISPIDKAQNTAIKKASRTAKTAGKNAKSAAKSAAKGIADAKAATSKAETAQGGVNGILGQVPAVLDSLSKLAAGLTAAGDGLTKLGNAVAAQEYGVVQVQIAGLDVPGAILVSPDIPDDGNSAIVSGTVLAAAPGGLGNAPLPVTLLAGVRSGESDGTGATDPVASAGIVTMSVAKPTGSGSVTIAGGTGGVPAVPITSAPNAALSGAPVYDIPLKAPRVDATPDPFSFPTDKAIDLTAQPLAGGGVPYTVASTAPAGTDIPITVTFTVRFNDLTASATDGTA